MIRFSYLLAVALAGGVGYYMLTGKTVVGGQPESAPSPIAERTTTANSDLFSVQIEPHKAQMRAASLEVRGRTEADATVSVRAQTSGMIEARPVSKGQPVNAGDLLCIIERGAREAEVARAEAQLIQTRTDLQAQEQLANKGFVAKNQVPALQAAVDAAQAALVAANWELERTEVRSPISGLVQDPLAELGDMLQRGDVCATVIDRDPMTFIGQVSEREIGVLAVGMTAAIKFIDGTEASGTVSYLSPSADPDTRTFLVEIDIPNPDLLIRDGITALAFVPLQPTSAHLISSSYLTLDDQGTLGVRTVGDDGVVEFIPVRIVGGSKDGIWVTGLKDGAAVITVGQDYVRAGQKVKAVTAGTTRLQPTQTAELGE